MFGMKKLQRQARVTTKRLLQSIHKTKTRTVVQVYNMEDLLDSLKIQNISVRTFLKSKKKKNISCGETYMGMEIKEKKKYLKTI